MINIITGNASNCMTVEFMYYSTIIPMRAYRDWFRINPLEMVILGCQTLVTGAPASRDVSNCTMTAVYCSI